MSKDRLPSIRPDQIRLRVIVTDDEGHVNVDEESSVVQMERRDDATDIFLSSGKSLRWTADKGWVCYNDYARRQEFPFEAQVFNA